MKKTAALFFAICMFLLPGSAYADTTHVVKNGESMWKIAVKYEIGVSEIINANSQVENPNLIYPGEVLNVPSIDSTVLNYESEVIRLVNDIRTQNGLGTLTQDWELCRIARYKSADMHDRGYFSHQSPTYGSPFTMIKSFGLSYRSAGENIAKGYRTPQAVVDGWMNSSGHRANILNSSYTRIGVGFVKDGYYWTQMFTS